MKLILHSNAVCKGPFHNLYNRPGRSSKECFALDNQALVSSDPLYFPWKQYRFLLSSVIQLKKKKKKNLHYSLNANRGQKLCLQRISTHNPQKNCCGVPRCERRYENAIQVKRQVEKHNLNTELGKTKHVQGITFVFSCEPESRMFKWEVVEHKARLADHN